MSELIYPDSQLLINGQWLWAESGIRRPVVNPATGEVIGHMAQAGEAELQSTVQALQHGFDVWRKVEAFTRYQIMRKAAQLLRERAERIAAQLSLEQGKSLAEALGEIHGSAETIEWFAEEARRTYGRLVPARQAGVQQQVVREPVGPVAAFTPWNFPIIQAVRKVAAALAAGCSVVVKGPEETPASCAELMRVFVDAGVPDGAVNLLYGPGAQISAFLISHPVVRKISFTGSTEVGKQLAELAGRHMKRATMELGGHAPVLVFADADLDKAVPILVQQKFRNCGQVCVSPTRFIVHHSLMDEFCARFVELTRQLKVGQGNVEGVNLGPLVNGRRLEAVQSLVLDAAQHGAQLLLGGGPLAGPGYFFAPTVMRDVPVDARIMNEEPFGPVAVINSFSEYDQAIAEANRLPFGLAAYAYSRCAKTVAALGRDVESGMLSINHHGVGLPELPFGGVKDSGYGSEGGPEAMEAYLVSKLISVAF